MIALAPSCGPVVNGPGTPVTAILELLSRVGSRAEVTALVPFGLTYEGIDGALQFARDLVAATYESPRVRGWGNVVGLDRYYHGVVAFNAGGSVLTACSGRWAAGSTEWIYAPGAYRDVSPKCGACVAAQNEQPKERP